ncbi:MAG: NADP-dependent oxidoreductase [Pseudomonadota bacterium]
MKAVRFHAYGDPSVLRLEDVPDPSPGPDEVLLDVHAAGVNPLDWKIRSGALAQGMPLPLPFVLGWDVSGTVAAVGESVSGLEVGDPVFGMIPIGAPGAYADYATAPANAMAKAQTDLPAEVLAAIPVVGLAAWQLIHEVGALAPGERVAVIGAGGQVGRLSIALAGQIDGTEVMAIGRRADLEAAGFSQQTRKIASDGDDWTAPIADADLIIDLVGGPLQTAALAAVKPGARLVSRAQPPDPAGRDVTVSMLQVHPDRSALERLEAGIASGELPRPVVETFPLASAAEAHAAGEAGANAKLVLMT